MRKTYPTLYKLADQIKSEIVNGNSETKAKPTGLMSKGNKNG